MAKYTIYLVFTLGLVGIASSWSIINGHFYGDTQPGRKDSTYGQHHVASGIQHGSNGQYHPSGSHVQQGQYGSHYKPSVGQGIHQGSQYKPSSQYTPGSQYKPSTQYKPASHYKPSGSQYKPAGHQSGSYYKKHKYY